METKVVNVMPARNTSTSRFISENPLLVVVEEAESFVIIDSAVVSRERTTKNGMMEASTTENHVRT